MFDSSQQQIRIQFPLQLWSEHHFHVSLELNEIFFEVKLWLCR